MCQSSQRNYTAVTGMVNVQTANPNLDGSGTLNTLFTADQTPGTVVKAITIKAAGSNEQGMARIFISDTNNNVFLWKEIPVPANVQSPTVAAYQTTIRPSYVLQAGYSLLVTTQNAESWNFIAECIEWINCPCPEEPTPNNQQ